MAKIFNKVLDFVGWEAVEEDENEQTDLREEINHNQNTTSSFKKQQNTKVVNMHSNSQFKVVVMRPENFDDAQEVTEHLKNKKPVVINLEELDKEFAQRLLDFFSGAVCALDGSIQKVSTGIFVIAPNNVDILGEFRDEIRNKAMFPWVK